MTKKLTQINNITYYIAGETSTYIALRAGSCSSSWMQISRLSEKFALTLVQNVRLSTSHRLQRGNKNIHSKTITFKNKQIHKSQHLICLKLMTEFLSRKTVSPLMRKDKNTVFIRLNAASLNLSLFQLIPVRRLFKIQFFFWRGSMKKEHWSILISNWKTLLSTKANL